MNQKSQNERLIKEQRLKTLTEELPPFLKQFFRGIEYTTSINTRIAYAYNIRIFFRFLLTKVEAFSLKQLSEITLEDLNHITSIQIEEYQEYLKYYTWEDKVYSNQERGIARKLSALSSLYVYFNKKQLLTNNPFHCIQMPKMHEKVITYLTDEEVKQLLDYMKDCEKQLKPHEIAYYQKTKLRDYAIISLLLGTGIRVSECAGLNYKDVNRRDCSIRIIRKGGNETILYYGNTTANALNNYIDQERPTNLKEDALFLSLKKTRLCVRSIERIVKKYSESCIAFKTITPHKLRSTYGTLLYQRSNDIYLVANVLGHADVNTTKKHYAAIQESRKKEAAQIMDSF